MGGAQRHGNAAHLGRRNGRGTLPHDRHATVERRGAAYALQGGSRTESDSEIRGTLRFLPQLEMRPSSNAPSPVESREAPPTSSFPGLSGFKTLDPDINIAGVILNKVKNKAHYLKTKKSIEEITNTEVIGGISRNNNISIEQRHLGLVPAREKKTSLKYIDLWSQTIKESIDMDRLVEIAKSAPKIESDTTPIWNKLNRQKVKIGVAYDEVFNFYYKENIESLEANNAKIEYFSPLNDEHLPDIDGLYIGGGYPELFSKQLNENKSMLKDIKSFHMDNHPIFAECGGLMYLMKSIHEDEQVNIYPYKSVLTDKVQALKYTIAEVQKDNIISKKGEKFNGHEFHYSKVIVESPKNDFAFKITRGKGSYNLQDGFMEKNTLASYVHTHVAAMPNFGGNLCISAKEK